MPILSNIFRLFPLVLILVSCSNRDSGATVSSNGENSFAEQNNESIKDSWYEGTTSIKGNAQGTTYIIKTSDDSLFLSPQEASTFFKEFDLELSTYKDSSLISLLNTNSSQRINLNQTMYFSTAYQLSKQVSEKTSGAFDPTVFPLVKAWGFFNDLQDEPSPKSIDSILNFVGFNDSTTFSLNEEGVLVKRDHRSKLDFNAIAQGQSVDEIAAILDSRGQRNYFIEVGGEIKAKGVNDRNAKWLIGIDQPTEENDGVTSTRKIENLVEISDNALATSGSYRKYYVKDGQRYSHTIDPKTGRPVQHNLLSVTVIHKSAALADAYATAFMTMGVEETLVFIKENKDLNLEVYLLFENEAGRIERAFSEGMNRFFQKG